MSTSHLKQSNRTLCDRTSETAPRKLWRVMVRSTTLIATVLWIGGASAQTLDIDRLSKEDFDKLTPEQRKPFPALEVMQKFDSQFAAAERAFVPLLLRDLGYGFREAFTGTDEQLQRWVTQFQHDIGEPETGVLTFGQMDILGHRADAVGTQNVRISLPVGAQDGPIVTVNDDFASAEGTWVIEGDQIAWPLNIATYQCSRKSGYCTESDVYIDNQSAPFYSVFTEQDTVPITSWKDQKVVLTTEATCRNITVTINARAKEVYEIARNNGRPCNVVPGTTIPPLDKPQISKLVSDINSVGTTSIKNRRRRTDTVARSTRNI
jgi:hypothetical protein